MQAKHVEVTSNSLLIGKTVKEAQDYSGGALILAIRKHGAETIANIINASSPLVAIIPIVIAPKESRP
jgi:hypothetical protein